jgi:two-component system LytT family response regulator
MIRALIADDERPARNKLRELLAREAEVEVVGEAADGVEAVAALRSTRPDVIFLDVKMPRLDGFGVIAEVSVEEMPAIVFVTAFDEHALKAFEVHAVDYLLKPFAPSRLHRLVERLRQQLAQPAAPPRWAAQMERLLATVRPAQEYLHQILLDKDEGRQVLVAADEIDFVRGDANYLRFFTTRGEFRRRGTLREIEERLDPARFLRLNRSEIVRLAAIRELQPWFHGDARVVLRDGTVLTWSRRYRNRAQGLF